MLNKRTVKRMGAAIVPISLFLVMLASVVSASSEEKNLELRLHELNIFFIAANIVLLAAITFFITSSKKLFKKNNKKTRRLKVLFFWLIAASVLFTSFFVAASTIYLNVVSETKGPVHWHADYEVWNCGKKLDLVDPSGGLFGVPLSNRVGTSTFHEHNDDRIHVEGVVVKKNEINLKSYISTVGGTLEKGKLLYPTQEKKESGGLFEVMEDGGLCEGRPGKLQMWLYRVENPDDINEWRYSVSKVEDYESYVMSPETIVPAGDCFILEFGPEREATDRICETYRVKEERGELFGR